MSRFAFDRVACARGGRLLFEHVSLTLDSGDAALVTGPNGAGKSSLLRIGAGLLRPFTGNVTREGAAALLAESTALDPERSLRDALAWWAATDDALAALDEALAATRLLDLADMPVRWLSTGQRRRAGIARVLVQAAPIWLLDEPANGLDTGSVEMLERIVRRHRSGGGIVIVATHLPIRMAGATQVTL